MLTAIAYLRLGIPEHQKNIFAESSKTSYLLYYQPSTAKLKIKIHTIDSTLHYVFLVVDRSHTGKKLGTWWRIYESN